MSACCSSARRLGVPAGLLGAAVGVFTAIYATTGTAAPDTPESDAGVADTVLDHKVETLSGAEADLAQYRGDVVLIVNVASRCGYTGQYKPLQAAFEKYKDRGFVVLGFPSNQFGGQEPGTPDQIAAFCEKNYGVSFPLMGKVEVKGDGATPLYRELTAEGTTGDPGPVKWNFEKFLVGRDGKVIARFRSGVDPGDAAFVAAVEKALEAPKPGAAAGDVKTAEG